jgi:hypothetical protein
MNSRLIKALCNVLADTHDESIPDQYGALRKATKGKLKPILKIPGVKEDDVFDAFAMVWVHLYDIDMDWDSNYSRVVGLWNKVVLKGKLKKLPVKKAAVDLKYFDNRRRIKGKALENPIIVGKIGGQNIVLDGSHRLISKIISKHSTITAFIIPLSSEFAELTAMQGEVTNPETLAGEVR